MAYRVELDPCCQRAHFRVVERQWVGSPCRKWSEPYGVGSPYGVRWAIGLWAGRSEIEGCLVKADTRAGVQPQVNHGP
jgi:hypothetical protein